MNESSHKEKYDEENSEERRTYLFLMKKNFQNNVIWYTLKNIIYIDKK